MRPQRCRVAALGHWLTPRGASLSGVRAASWRFAPYCSHGTRSLKLRRGRAAFALETVELARRLAGGLRGTRASAFSDFSGDILPVSWRLPRSGAPD